MNKQSGFKIKKSLLKSSNRCDKNYICNTENWKSCGKMNEVISDMILHIDESFDENRMLLCPYHIPFGGDHYCSCPTRMYIYKKFNV